ncbi:DUF3987 domain-containing protein [Francisella hispaniensis]|uniref:DUF3987 domain-containing protein n=2 Tax=Francisella hispaniensis TaxID=622488 RepID=A0AAC9NN69_9GAMM|nr:DUF3987 domain-containing protein [Francisella hispaniensis]APD50185.1 hypothetical protein FSC454_03040 [Francisella hispaniensis FSC454]KYW85204.1 hypothetical protein AUF42_00995 [Francisella hispaniensis FSC454]
MSNVVELTTLDDNIEILKGKPRELPKKDKQIPIFDKVMLPEIIGDYVYDLANVIQQPVQYVACASLTSLAGLLGNKVRLDINEKRKVTPVLWSMLVGESGTGKTPSIQEAIKPLKMIDDEFYDRYLEELRNYKIQLEFEQNEIDEYKAKLKNYDKLNEKDKTLISKDDLKAKIIELEKDKTIKPYSREVYINQATKEALIKQLSVDSPNGLLVDIDELIDWLNSITRADKSDDHGLYVSGYNGHSYKSKTVSRDTQKVDSITLSIIGGVQTNRLLEFTKKYSGSGLLARFQLIPIAEKSLRIYKEKTLNSAIESRYINLINNLKNIPERFNIVDNEIVKSEPNIYQYTSEAKSVYIEWFNEVQKDIQRSDHSDLMIEYLGKADNTFHTLALIYHLAGNQDTNIIAKDTVERVVLMMAYLYECANYLYGDDFDEVRNVAQKIIDRKSKFNNKNGFSVGDVARPKIFRKLDKELLESALEMLANYNHIQKTNSMGTKYTKYKWLY